MAVTSVGQQIKIAHRRVNLSCGMTAQPKYFHRSAHFKFTQRAASFRAFDNVP
jgi:hypothetical protein